MSFTKETESSVYPGTVPAAHQTLKQELLERMEEFLEMDRFALVIQPVVNFRNQTVKDGEVLSRLEHPELGVIFPDEFLPVIDALELYPSFDRYIFEKCCIWLRNSMTEGKEFNILSCNFSRKTLSEADIVQDLIQIADNYGIEHSKLGLEITEHDKISNEQQMIKNLNLLNASGFRIILDDYGTGVTSETDLIQYPLDILKIDRSLLLKAGTEQGRTAFIAMVDMFKKLGAEVVCEGIETKEQDRLVRESGCHYGQGYYYFKPIHHNQVFEVIQKSGSMNEET